MNPLPDRELDHLLLTLESGLLDHQVRTDPARVGSLLAEDFVEIGQSGRRFDRQEILRELAREAPGRTVYIEEFNVRSLAPDIAMATFQTVVNAGTEQSRAARVSLWRCRDGEWQLFYHQGTPVPA